MDSYTKVTTKWYGSRIMDSIKWILFWFIMFIVSFIVLWTNEWTVDLSTIAKNSTVVDSVKIDSATEWKFVAVTWEINSEEVLWDNLYLKAGKYISISRTVEMYSWEEETKTETEKNVGWSETTTTTYTYNTVWTESPDDSSSFDTSSGHFNPGKSLQSVTDTVGNSNIWAYNIDTPSIKLPGMKSITLTKDIVVLENNSTWSTSLVSGYLYKWEGTFSNPKVWDIRISYSVLNNGTNVTAMWTQTWDKITSFIDEDGNKIYRVFNWTKAAALSTLKNEYLFKLWAFRALWFILMWFGLSLLLWPISVLLDVLPMLWGLSRWIIWIITFIISAILSIITILISIIFHNIFALIIAVAVVWFFWYRFVKQKMDNKEKPNEEIKVKQNNTLEKSEEVKEEWKEIKEVKEEWKVEDKKNTTSVGFDIE